MLCRIEGKKPLQGLIVFNLFTKSVLAYDHRTEDDSSIGLLPYHLLSYSAVSVHPSRLRSHEPAENKTDAEWELLCLFTFYMW
jgi:hypothetical protein